MHRTSAASLALLLALAPGTLSETRDPVLDSFLADIRFLTDPELEGRGAASRGGAVTAAWVAARLEAEGWIPAGDPLPEGGRSWYQAVPAVETTLDREHSTLELLAGGRAHALPFLSLPDRAEALEVRGPVVFAGFGIRAPEYGHDDYAGPDVSGKVVVVFSGEPGETDPDSPWLGTRPTRHALAASKSRLARELGATALVLTPNPAGRAATAAALLAGRAADLDRPFLGLAGAEPALPVLYVDREALTPWVTPAGLDFEEASRALEAGGNASRPLAGLEARVVLSVRDVRNVETANVLARLGAGKGLQGEVVLAGAHWDGLGVRDGVLHPGADDNASGVAVLLAAARALAGTRPESGREILLGFWTAEEHGRLGSAAFAAAPVVPRERIAVAVNLDMLGRNNFDREDYAGALQLIYSAQAPVLREIAARANDGVGFDLRYFAGLRFQPVSDHYSFFEAGIPVVYPFSGYHTDYHAPGDTPDKLLPERLGRSGRFVERLLRELARHPGRIQLDPAIREAPPPDPFERPGS